MFLIVGLGNPGKEYEHTRHNIGFRALDRLAKDLDIAVSKGQCQALIGQGKISETKVILAKPQTFMNLSGNSVLELMNWYKIEPNRTIIIHDDMDLDIGTVRIRAKGNSGGHNGIESIIHMLGTTEFARIKIGIGRKTIGGDNSDYVLSNIPADQQEILGNAIVISAEAAAETVEHGIENAMNKYNPL